jgi:hypothetical protein
MPMPPSTSGSAASTPSAATESVTPWAASNLDPISTDEARPASSWAAW